MLSPSIFLDPFLFFINLLLCTICLLEFNLPNWNYGRF